MLRYATTLALLSSPAYADPPPSAPPDAVPSEATGPVASDAAPPADAVRWAAARMDAAPPEPCGALPAGAITLASAEFDIEVRVPKNTVRVVMPTRLTATATRPALSLVGGAPAVHIASSQINSIRDAHRAGALSAVVGLTEAPGPRADASCAESRIDKVNLFVSDVLVGSYHRTPPKAAQATTRVLVGAPMLEPDSPQVPEAVLREKLTAYGQACVRKMMGDRVVRGSVHLELRSDADGNLRRPTLAVDGLQRPELTFCLINAIYDDPSFGPILPAGAHLYATWYMQPAASPVFTDQVGQ